MSAPRKYDYSPERLLKAAPGYVSLSALAVALGIEPTCLVHHLRGRPDLNAQVRAALKVNSRPPSTMDPAGMTVRKDGERVVTGEPVLGGLATQDAEGYLRERWGLPAEEWLVGSVTVNEWEGPAGGGSVVTYAQAKGTFRKIADLGILSPAQHCPPLVRTTSVRRKPARAQTWVIEYDHQAPYHDPLLDTATTAMVADLQPDGHLFGGDLLDLPTISKHADHPSAQATPQECVDAGYGILRRRAEAAPGARRIKLRGNHDWRIEGEQLARAERLHGLAPAGEAEAALSLRRLLHLDTLGVELVEDPRGWQHDEAEIVPGPKGLVARHGWLTGANTAEKSMKKRGRSILVGHTHQPEHHYWWDPSMECHRQGVVVGAMCLTRNVRFPHFAVLDNWMAGPATVTVLPNGEFVIEQSRWVDGRLYWRDRSWKP